MGGFQNWILNQWREEKSKCVHSVSANYKVDWQVKENEINHVSYFVKKNAFKIWACLFIFLSTDNILFYMKGVEFMAATSWIKFITKKFNKNCVSRMDFDTSIS